VTEEGAVISSLNNNPRSANARIYIGFDKHMQATTNGDQEK
jgi:hypothetical protein